MSINSRGMYRPYNAVPTKMGNLEIQDLDRKCIVSVMHTEISVFLAEQLMDHMAAPLGYDPVNYFYSIGKLEEKDRQGNDIYVILGPFKEIIFQLKDFTMAENIMAEIKKNLY